MSTTPLGNPSAMHPKLGMTWKRAMKIERIARLSADPAGYSNEQIANHLGCDKQTIVLIRQLPEYHAKMLEVMSGVTSSWDQELRQDTEASRQEMKSMVPSAMMVIRNALLSKNENIRVRAAMEVFDREGTHAKVSKSSVAIVQAPNMTVDPLVASNLMQLLASAPPNGSGAEIGAATGAFTMTAQEAGAQQVTMAQDNTEKTLEELDLPAVKPN